MNQLQEEIYKTVDIIIQNRLKDLKYDVSKKGKVVHVDGDICIVKIDGEEYECKIKRGIYVAKNDVVEVSFPLGSNVNRYVTEVVEGEGDYLFLKMLSAKNGNSMILDCGLPDSVSNGAIIDGGGVRGF